MSKHEFLHSTLRDVHLKIESYRKEKEYRVKEIEYQSWLVGAYVRNAIISVFPKGSKYPENPLSVKGSSTKEIAKKVGKSEQELAQEEQYFSMIIKRANANISKKKKEEENTAGES